MTPVAAQVPDSVRADTARIDTLATDTAAGPSRAVLDSLLRARATDTVPVRPDSSPLLQYLAAEALAEVRVATPDPILPRGPQPAGGRIVLSRDSIEWAHATTLADLLQRVPGVYLWRGGWTGQPELPNFEARGPTAVEYYLDGLPYIPAGSDSVGVDPSLFALSLLERVEIERWPGLLRVYLVTRRHDRLAARSQIGVSRGTGDLARYRGSVERWTRTGLGFALGADNLSVPAISNIRPRFANTQLFAQVSYLPSPRWGMVAQVLRSGPSREPVLGGIAGDTLSRRIAGARRFDWQLRGLWRRDTTGLGPRADVLIARTTASDSLTPGQEIWQAGAVASWRLPQFSVSASAFARTRWTSLDLRSAAGWMPHDRLTVTAEGGFQRHDGGRTSTWVAGRLGLALPLGARVVAAGRFGSVVVAPAVPNVEAQDIRDWHVLAGWEQRWAAVEAGYARTAAFQPLPYQPYPFITSIDPVPATDWVTLSVRVTPLSWFSIDGWLSDPRTPTPMGQPPRHTLVAATIRTHLQRVFRSGILGIKLRMSLEHWGEGVLGRDAAGDPVVLGEAAYWRSQVQIALGSFQFYWDRGNLRLESEPYVPGLPIRGRPDEFGVRWEFSN